MKFASARVCHPAIDSILHMESSTNAPDWASDAHAKMKIANAGFFAIGAAARNASVTLIAMRVSRTTYVGSQYDVPTSDDFR